MNTTNETHPETAHHKAILDAIAENQKQLEDIAEKQKQMQDVTLAVQEIQRLLRKQESRWTALWRGLTQFMSLSKD